MLIAFDIGNTHIDLALFSDGVLLARDRVGEGRALDAHGHDPRGARAGARLPRSRENLHGGMLA